MSYKRTLLFSREVVSDSLRPHELQHTWQSSLSLSMSLGLLKLMSIESVRLSNHLILCHPCLLLPSIFPSIKVISNELALRSGGQSIGASTSVLPMNSGLISFRINWSDLLAVQGTLKSLSSTTVQKHPFFSIQPSLWFNSHMHTRLLGKNIALIIQTFVSKVMSLLFNILSRLT